MSVRSSCAPSREWIVAGLIRMSLAAVLLLLTAPIASGQESPYAVAVEEDWELVVVSPDPNSAGPQVSCAISPHTHVDAEHATFELNHQSLPTFVAGGIQLLSWNGESHVSSHKSPRPDVMGTAGERVTWTQNMELDSGNLTFEVVNGHSVTWGDFGGQGYLKLSIPTDLNSLDSYNPGVSVQNSGVTYAGNRVASLKLLRVRMILSNGVVLEDNTVRVVHELQ